MNSIVLIRNANQADFGGGERFSIFLAEALNNTQYQPTIISRHRQTLQLAASHNIKTLRSWWWSKQDWSGKSLLLLPLYLAWQIILCIYYLKVFIGLRPKVVHIQSKDDFIAATYAARLVGARVIWTDHADLKHIWKNINIWYKNPIGKLVYLAAHAAHAITLVSKSEETEVTKNLPPHAGIIKKLVVVYNGVADSKNRYPEDRQSIYTYGVVGRLVADKGIAEAIDAFEKVHRKYPNTQLLLVGSGPDEATFKERCGNAEAIIFTGHQTDPLASIAKLDVFMQPTYHEGFSLSLVEACMMERPIIATSVGGNPEIIIHNKTGLLVKAKDSHDLANAMEKLHNDHALAKRVAQAARQQYCEKFVFDSIVKERFVPLYEKNPH